MMINEQPMIKDYFGDEIIGQHRAKQTLNFVINSQQKTGFLRPIFLTAPRGSGKTSIARKIGENLTDSSGRRKLFLECNGSSIKQLGNFVNQIIAPFIVNRDATLFIDEIHSVSLGVREWLLSVLQPNADGLSQASFNGQQYDFNFNRFSFIGASTNPEQINLPLKDRLRRVDLETYSMEDLSKILTKNLNKLRCSDGIEHEIVACSRKNPRQTVFIARDIIDYAKNRQIKTITRDHWLNIKKVFNIRPLGLLQKEIQLLRILNDHGHNTLTSLASKLGLDQTTVRREVESYLLANNLIRIEGHRSISEDGRRILQDCQ